MLMECKLTANICIYIYIYMQPTYLARNLYMLKKNVLILSNHTHTHIYIILLGCLSIIYIYICIATIGTMLSSNFNISFFIVLETMYAEALVYLSLSEGT